MEYEMGLGIQELRAYKVVVVVFVVVVVVVVLVVSISPNNKLQAHLPEPEPCMASHWPQGPPRFPGLMRPEAFVFTISLL